MDKPSFCSCILCVAPSLAGPQTPLVFDNRKKDSSWAFPGGNPIFLKNLERFEYPMETARRKLQSETGIIAGLLEPIEMIEKKGHQWHLFLARLENLNAMKPRGEKGQFVAVFPTHHLIRMDAFLAPHRRVMAGLDNYLQL